VSRIEEWTKPTPYGHGTAYIDVDDHDQVLVSYEVLTQMLVDLGWTRTDTPGGVSPGNTSYRGGILT
jgi:hypothetical protein